MTRRGWSVSQEMKQYDQGKIGEDGMFHKR